MLARILDPGALSPSASFGLLLLRVVAGGTMAAGHGWGKLLAFSEKAGTFPDPLGIGNRLSMAGAVGAELFCSVLVVLGLGTRLAALPVAFTMTIAAFVIHAADPFGRKELAVVYLAVFLAIALVGPGRYSLDARAFGGKKRR